MLQVAEKQATLVALETQLGSTSTSAAENRDQIQRLQLQMTELQNEHVAWQRTMLDGRLQELRVAAARVENNQALKVVKSPPSHSRPLKPCLNFGYCYNFVRSQRSCPFTA